MNRGKRAQAGSSSRKGKIFEHSEVTKYYGEKMIKRGIIPETSMLYVSEGNLSHQVRGVREIDEVRRAIHNNQWVEWIGETDEFFSRQVVWEFYANAWWRAKKGDGKRVSYVRGVEVPYDAETIARVMDLPQYDLEEEDEEDMFSLATFTDNEKLPLEELKRELFLDGRDWNLSVTNRVKHVNQQNLQGESRFWVKFVVHNLDPHSHDTEVSPSVCRLVYALRTGMTVDAASIISDRLHRFAQLERGYVGYPWVIHKLCTAAGAYFGDDVRELRRSPRMTYSTWENYLELARRAAPQPRAQPPSEPQFQASSSSQPVVQPGGMEEMMHMMQSLMQGQQSIRRRQSRAMEYDRREMRRNQARDACLGQLAGNQGISFAVPPYTEEDIALLETSSAEGMEQDHHYQAGPSS